MDELHVEDPLRRRQAQDELGKLYWPAIYAYLRHSGLGREAAEESTQAFFVDVVFGRGLLDTAASERGRLRSLILTALRRHQVDQHRRSKARRNERALTLDDATVRREDAAIGDQRTDPAVAFDRSWAVAQVEESLRRCRERFERDKEHFWKAFEDRIVGPTVRMTSPTPLVELAERLGFNTAADAAAAVQAVRKKFEVILRDVVAETVRPEDLESEYQQLRTLLC